jgi:methylase of polypeptide subunit release factors
VQTGKVFKYQATAIDDVIATDSDNDALTNAVENAALATGVNIDKLGQINWKPTTANIGIKPVTDPIGAVLS